jgi:tetratricopeptide (TPR) repeat protein
MIELKKAHELDVVELTEDLAEYGLHKGAQGTVVEVFDNPEEAYMVEFLEDEGASSTIADWVKPDQIKNITAIAKEYYERGMSYLQNGNLLDASRGLRQAVDLIPSYIRSLHESLAKPLSKKEDWASFIIAMRFIMLIDSSYEFARNNLAIAYLNYGVEEANKSNYKNALDHFYLALTVDATPDITLLIRENIATSHIILGVKTHQRGDFQLVVQHFQAAYMFNPNERTRYNLGLAYANLAKFYVGTGKLEDAIKHYIMAEDAGLITPAVLNNHAIALAKAGDVTGAMMLFESALHLAPEDKTIISNLSILTQSGHFPDFITEEVAIEFSPTPQMNVAELSVAL